MRQQEHSNEVYETNDGFKITPSDETRPEIIAKIDEYGFWHFENNKQYNNTIPLYNFYALLEIAINLLYESWIPPKKPKTDSIKFKIEKWAKGITKKTLAKKLHGIWKKHCESIDPLTNEVHKKMYSVSNGSGYWRNLEYLLKNKEKYKYLIDDILKYRAARIAVLHSRDISTETMVESTIDAFHYDIEITNFNAKWMKAYSYDGEEYTSLNKTLMNLPYGVTYYRLFNLREIRLPEPATTRMRLWAYVALAKMHQINEEKKLKLIHVIVKSTDEQIKNAIRYIWKYFPSYYTGDFRRSVGIESALETIFDYPFEIGNWDIMGLAKRSEVYHHDTEMQERVRVALIEEQRLAREKEQEKLLVSNTALPPIPLPDDKNIIFLDTYASVHKEGKLMGHCISQYAESAVKGYCYLFHIDYKNTMASVEISPQGYVCQSYGPKDTTNEASEYGRKVLGKWAKGFNNEKTISKEGRVFTEGIDIDMFVGNTIVAPIEANIQF